MWYLGEHPGLPPWTARRGLQSCSEETESRSVTLQPWAWAFAFFFLLFSFFCSFFPFFFSLLGFSKKHLEKKLFP